MDLSILKIKSCLERLELFIFTTGEYGKPRGNNIQAFISNFYKLHENGNFYVPTQIDEKMQEEIANKSIRNTGGLEFYKDLVQQKFNSQEEMESYLAKYSWDTESKEGNTEEILEETIEEEIEDGLCKALREAGILKSKEPQQPKQIIPYTIEDFNREVIGINGEELKEKALRSLNILLSGVPGTGKTVTAYALAQLICEEKGSNRISRIQLNSSYSYTDLMCYKAYTKEGTYTVEKASLLSLTERARKDPDNKYVMIIDEMSRGRLETILGESITYLEKQHRNEEFETMCNTIESFPSNLYLIGTMNNCDISVIKIDRAISQRFKTIRLNPIWENKAELEKLSLTENQLKLVEKIVKLNNSLDDPEDRVGNRILFNMMGGDTLESIIEDDVNDMLDYIFALDINELNSWKEEFNILLKEINEN